MYLKLKKTTHVQSTIYALYVKRFQMPLTIMAVTLAHVFLLVWLFVNTIETGQRLSKRGDGRASVQVALVSDRHDMEPAALEATPPVPVREVTPEPKPRPKSSTPVTQPTQLKPMLKQKTKPPLLPVLSTSAQSSRVAAAASDTSDAPSNVAMLAKADNTPPQSLSMPAADSGAQSIQANPKLVPLSAQVPQEVGKLSCNIPKPEYPQRSRRRGEAGEVAIRIVVDEHGHIRQTTLQRGSGYPLLDSAAQSAALASVCLPYIISGRSQAVTAVQVFHFEWAN